jgi:hypothetical protein
MVWYQAGSRIAPRCLVVKYVMHDTRGSVAASVGRHP